MATQATVLTAIRDRLDEPTARAWSDTQLRYWINEAVREIARRTEYAQDTSDISVSADDQEYTLPTDMIRLHRVEWRPDSSSQIYPLDIMEFSAMDQLWATHQAISRGRPVACAMWGYPPSCNLVVYPTPTEDGDLRVFYYKQPAGLATSTSADASTALDIPGGWEDAVVDYAEMCALRKDGDQRWREAQMLFEQRVDSLVELSQRWTDEVGMITTGYSYLPSWLVDFE